MKYYILALISAIFLCSCSLIREPDSDCPDISPETTETITLSFKMISANIGSRADAFHEEINSEWPAFEDLIDVNNFAFFIFLEPSGGESRLVMKMTDIGSSTNPNSMITGGFGAYTVTTVIPKQNFENLLGREIDINSTDPVKFRIVLLANAPGGTDYNLLAPADPVTAGSEGATTYSEFIANANELAFNLNNVYSSVENDASVDGIYKGSIPMFGMSTFTTTEEQLYLSRPEERINIGDIYLLRSLAKIRVLDKAPKSDGYPYVKAVTVEGTTNMAWIVPADVSNDINNHPYTNGQQVHTPRIHSKSADNSTTYRLGFLNNANTLERFGYIPEQAIAYGNPVIHITAQLDASREQTYDIPMGGSDEYPLDINGGFGDNILRNHIYTLSVERIAVGTPAEITLTVDDWTPNSFDLNYTETVTVNPRMEWDGATMDGDVTAKSEVFVKPFTADGKPVVLEGSFTIHNPMGAPWSAYLIPNGGVNDAFVFTDKTGEAEWPSFSGTVDATPTTLYIKPTNPEAIGEANRAILQVVVQVNGKTIVVPLVDDKAPDLSFTIVQMNKQ